MRQRHIMTGFDMEHSHPNIPPINPVSTLGPYDNNNSMFNGLPQYHPPPSPPHYLHHPPASSLGPAMSAPPSLYLPYAPPSHPLALGSHVHESNPDFMGHGYKRKSSEVIPGNYQYVTESTPCCSFPPETAPYTFPHYPTTYSQPMDQRSVRSRVGGAVTIDPPPYYAAHPFPPPAPIWCNQHVNDNNTSDHGSSSSSFWLQPPSIPFMPGNSVTGSSSNVCLPRSHEASSSRNDRPVSYPMPNYFSHPPPPPTVYPRMASASSYPVPVAIHDASYMRPVQPTGFRMNLNRDDFSSAATLRHNGLPHLRAIPAYEEDEGDLDDDDVDDHQDMRLDIDGMSYEELLALSDDIGTVKTGLSEETVKELVKRRTSVTTRINLEETPPSTDLETDFCTICQESYKNQEKIATLDCKHEYHAECLEKWLVIKNLCPICKSEALVMEKRSSIGGEVSADLN